MKKFAMMEISQTNAIIEIAWVLVCHTLDCNGLTSAKYRSSAIATNVYADAVTTTG
jgi:hypothetical protein